MDTKTKLPFGLPTEGFDGTVPYATIEVWDPGYNDGLTVTCASLDDFMGNWAKISNVVRGEQQTWGGKYLFHSIGQPALTFYNGDKIWFKNGQLHNEHGPAIEVGQTKMYALGGIPVPEPLFSDYIRYLERLQRAPTIKGRIATFPNRYEIKDANKYELFLYFDYDLNYYWMDADGNLHHPTEPAFQGFSGLIQHWNRGKMVSERIDSAFRNESLDRIRKEIDEMVKQKYETVADLIAGLDGDELRPLFDEAAKMFEVGYHVEEVVDWFGRAYGDGWPEDFSKQLVETFQTTVESVAEHMEQKQKVEAASAPEERPDGRIFKRGVVPPTAELKTESSRQDLAALQKLIAAAKRLEDAAVKKLPEQPMLVAHTGPLTSESKDESDSNGWAVPLGALAVAGIVGMLGAKKEVVKERHEPAFVKG